MVTSGTPTVLINGQPAATVGSLHVCPVCAPGPHVGGPVLAGAPTVLIGGMAAARVGDLCACTAPAPDAIVQGSPNVLIGGASAGSSPGLAVALASAHSASLQPGTPGTGTEARPLSPYVGVGYVDKAGRPVAGWHYVAEAGAEARRGQVGSGGQVWVDALAGSGSVSVGLVGVHTCAWERAEARVGEAVGMSARCVGLDGEAAVFEVWRETVAADGRAERVKVWEAPGDVAGGRAEPAQPFVFAWDAPEGSARADGEPPPGILPVPAGHPGMRQGDSGIGAQTPPTYVCSVSVATYRARGGPLRYQDWMEVEVLDADGAPVRDAQYRLELSTGEVREGRTDAAGRLREEGLPPGEHRLMEVVRPDTASRRRSAP